MKISFRKTHYIKCVFFVLKLFIFKDLWYLYFGDIMIKMSQLEKTFFRTMLVFLLFWYGAYWQYIPVWIFHLDVQNLSNTMKVILSTFSSFITFFIFFFLYRQELKKEFKIFKKKLLENLDVGFRYWILGLVIMMVSNLIIIFVFKSGGANNEQLVQEMIEAMPWFMIIEAGFLAPFNEEIVFRKAVKDVTGKRKWIFVLLSFLLFGGAHIIGNVSVWVDFLYIIPYGVLGASFALSYYETDTVFTPMSMHMAHNLILTLLSIVKIMI